jgi:cytochrome b subunit of formate dehydrogenase
MDDIVRERGTVSESQSSRHARPKAPEPPRSDVGTLVLHWLTAIAMTVSLVTGIRIAADAMHAPFSKWMAAILPQGEIWTWHFVAGLTLLFSASAYAVYMWRAGLASRNDLNKTRVLTMHAPSKLKWGAVNVVLHWFLYALVVFMAVTGIMLYLGRGGWWVYVHSTAAFVALTYILVHTVTHYLYGGWWQIFRLFRPARLVITKAVRPRPVLLACVVGVLFAAGIYATDWATRDTLVVRRVAAAPDLKKLLDDPAWATARPVFVKTQQGINLGGSGESTVEVRAVRDATNIYFAFRWEDPSRSVRRVPLVKKADGWHHIADHPYIDDVTTFYEDKFAVTFSPRDAFGAGGVSHLGDKPHADFPGSRKGLGLHYTDGTMIDMWQWKPARGGLLGAVDDMFMGPPTQPTPDQASQLVRYQGGYWGDPGTAAYVYNFEALRPHEYKDGQPIKIKRLPKDLAATLKAMGHWDPDPDASVDDGSHWWMMEDESVPYTAELDAKIPVGTIIPGVLLMDKYAGDRGDVHGEAHWADGHWTLVTSRKLVTGSKYDRDFHPGEDTYMWVSVFDHTQTRHTRHVRPVRIVVQE